jgi:lipoprotein-anchoring transpeptidase ErfK/SrfK
VLSDGRKGIGIFIAVAGIVAVLAGGAYAYDSSRDERIAEGVTVAGVAVGGMSAKAAESKLADELAPQLERSVRVRVAGRRFRLTPERASLAVDSKAMADAAVERTRSAWIGGRVWRSLTSGRIDEDLPAAVHYSRSAVRGFVAHVRRTVNRPPRDAEVKLQTASLPAIPSRRGLELIGRKRLTRQVVKALGQAGGERTVRARVKVVQPKLTTRELAKKYPHFITIDRPAFRLRHFERLRLAKTYTIAVGQVGLETPAGLYHIENKAVNPAWHVPNSAWAGSLAGRVIPGGTPENPLKSRWMGIYAGAGIHGTADVGSLGTAASHGCIRMAIPDVEELYDQVPVQTPVFVQ